MTEHFNHPQTALLPFETNFFDPLPESISLYSITPVLPFVELTYKEPHRIKQYSCMLSLFSLVCCIEDKRTCFYVT